MGPPGALAPFEKETWVCLPMLVVTAGDRAVTVRERAGIPNAGNNGRVPIGDRARSLTVTALSCSAYFMISWRMKFQVSGAPAVLPHSRKKLRGVSVLRSPVSAPVPEECPIQRQINELRPFSIQI